MKLILLVTRGTTRLLMLLNGFCGSEESFYSQNENSSDNVLRAWDLKAACVLNLGRGYTLGREGETKAAFVLHSSSAWLLLKTKRQDISAFASLDTKQLKHPFKKSANIQPVVYLCAQSSRSWCSSCPAPWQRRARPAAGPRRSLGLCRSSVLGS